MTRAGDEPPLRIRGTKDGKVCRRKSVDLTERAVELFQEGPGSVGRQVRKRLRRRRQERGVRGIRRRAGLPRIGFVRGDERTSPGNEAMFLQAFFHHLPQVTHGVADGILVRRLAEGVRDALKTVEKPL